VRQAYQDWHEARQAVTIIVGIAQICGLCCPKARYRSSPYLPAQALRDLLAQHYRDHGHVHVLDADQTNAMTRLDPQALNGSNDLQLAVFGNDAHGQVLLRAVFDNLGQGASGAAVQNLVLMLGLAHAWNSRHKDDTLQPSEHAA